MPVIVLSAFFIYFAIAATFYFQKIAVLAQTPKQHTKAPCSTGPPDHSVEGVVKIDVKIVVKIVFNAVVTIIFNIGISVNIGINVNIAKIVNIVTIVINVKIASASASLLSIFDSFP